MVRSALGVLVGAILWQPAFFILAWLLALIWPAYAVSGRTWFEENVFVFTASMAVFNVLFWILSEIFAGWITLVIAKRREAVWVLATLILLYLATLHIVLYWDRFPWWYNVAVVITSAASVLLGGRLADRFVSPRVTMATDAR